MTGLPYEESKNSVFVFTVRDEKYFIPTLYDPIKHVILIIDEIPTGIDIEFLLSICGDTDIKMEVKGGHTVIRSSHIVLCSNIPWNNWFSNYYNL